MNNLYIGLGGAGINALNEVYEKTCTEESNQCNNKYVLIDTDLYSRNSLSNSLQRSFIDIGAESPSQIKARALQSPLKRWFVGWYDGYDYPFSINDGSGAIRSNGRIGLYGKYDDIYQRLSTILCQSATELHPEDLLKIFVVTGSCGGTGSAILMDIMYLLNTILKSGSVPNAERCDNVFLLVAMPEMWIGYYDKNLNVQHKLISNAVAFFTELQFAIDNKNAIPSPYYPAIPPKKWMEDRPFSPFRHGYALESRGKSKEQVSFGMADLVCSLSEGNPIYQDDVRILTGNMLAEWLQSHKEISNGNYSFVDWKFARKVLDTDKNSDVGTDEIWDRLCNQ